MRSFFLLLRVQLLALANSLMPRRRSGSTGRANTGRIALAVLGGGALTLLCVFYMGMLGLGLAALGLGEAIPAFAVVVGALASVVFTFLKANGTLFGLADFDLVMSLPIPRRTVVASRVAALYASAVLMGAVVALPLWVVYLALVNLSAWTVACCVASILLAPAIPTSIATFLAFGVAAISSRFRHANLAYVLVALVGFSALIIVIYGFSFTAGTQTDEQTFAMMSGALSGASDAIAAAWPPARLLVAACAGSPLAFAGFVGASVVIPAIALEVVQRSYLTINNSLGTKASGSLSARDLHRKSAVSSSAFKAIMFKEYRALLGIPAYAFNCLFGYLLMIIVAVALSMVGLRGIITSGAIDGVDISPALFDAIAAQIMNLLPWPFLFCCIAAPSAACSLSMEGSGAWIMATAPVSVRTMLGAKLAANAVPVAATLAISSIILVVFGQTDLLGAAQIMVCGFGCFYLMVSIGLALDARNPNYSWTSPNEVVKRGLPIMVTVIGGMLLAFGGGALCWIAMDTFGLGAGIALNLGAGALGALAGQLIFEHTCRTVTFYVN